MVTIFTKESAALLLTRLVNNDDWWHKLYTASQSLQSYKYCADFYSRQSHRSGPVWNCSLDKARLPLRRKVCKQSVFLTLKTLLYHRCKFSISISMCSTHKFPIKINQEPIKIALKNGSDCLWYLISFNWNQTAELWRFFLDGSMVSISRRGFLSNILRNTRFPFRGKPNKVTRHCFALVSNSSCIVASLTSGSLSFSLPLAVGG